MRTDERRGRARPDYDQFTVSWSGSEGAGPGIASYIVYVSDKGEEFTLRQANATATRAGQGDHTYRFVVTEAQGNAASYMMNGNVGCRLRTSLSSAVRSSHPSRSANAT
jgi:hypothetical protein